MSANGGVYIERFSATERTLHWMHATAFFVLLGSGLVLYVPSLSVAIGRRPLMKNIHVYTALAWLVALALILTFGDRSRLRKTAHELDLFDDDDVLWLRRHDRPQGRFNAGQKLNAALTASLTLLFFVSGGLLWLGERDTTYRFASTILLHDGLMYISLVLLVGHLWLTLIYPATRDSLHGMTNGTVRYEYARRHHAKWLAERAAEAEARERSTTS